MIKILLYFLPGHLFPEVTCTIFIALPTVPAMCKIRDMIYVWVDITMASLLTCSMVKSNKQVVEGLVYIFIIR